MKREHWGVCWVLWDGIKGGPYPTMEGAIEALDPFQGTERGRLAFAIRTNHDKRERHERHLAIMEASG